MPGILYLIPNTLGLPSELPANPLAGIIPEQVQQISARLSYFVAENAKTTRAYLKLLSQQTPLAHALQEIQITELNVQTDSKLLPAMLEPILAGQDGGLISEAGLPAVADPGANLVRLAHQKNIVVRPLVGPSSLMLALMASGLNGQSFAFNGYLPTDASERSKRLKELENRSRQDKQSQIFIETPYRNGTLLQALIAGLHPNTLLCRATNLSLPDEVVQTMRVQEWRQLGDKLPEMHKKPTVFLFLAS
ncbi:MAG: SAM-dependent methyltransferase [Burkholderiales bacterium]|nr:SAM-dependent methyltransferase [Burkholderiales bacterium]